MYRRRSTSKGVFRHRRPWVQRRPWIGTSTAALTQAPAGLSSVTVAALGPSASIAANAGLAGVSASALQPTVVTGTQAPAGVAAVTAAALQAAASISPNAGLAGVTAAALSPSKSIKANAGLAGVTVTAYNPTTDTATEVHLLVGNVDFALDYLDKVKTATLKIKTTGDRRASTMDVTLIGTPTQFYGVGAAERVVTEAIILFQWGGDPLFSGAIRTVEPVDAWRPGHVALQLGCQDWTFLATDSICNPVLASAVRTDIESDAARIAWLWTTFCDITFAGVVMAPNTSTFVKTIVTSMPAQDFTGLNLAQAMDEICKLTGGTWYLDMAATGSAGSGIIPNPSVHYLPADAGSKALTTPFGVAATDTLTSTAHGLVAGDAIIFPLLQGGTGLSSNGPIYYVISSGLTANAFKVSLTPGGAAVDFTTDITGGRFMTVQPAPFGLSDQADNATTYPYKNLKVKTETTEYRTGVVVVGGEGYAATFGDASGRLGVISDDSIINATAGALAAAAYLERNTIGVEGSVDYWHSGLEPGMVVEITSENQIEQRGEDPELVEVGSVFRVSTVEASYEKLQADIDYKASFGRVPRLLHTAIKDIAQAEAELAATKVVNGVLAGYVGEIVGWPLSTPPVGFLLCNGQSLLRAGTYAKLFGVIGTTFGFVDGTHFNVPDLRGRFPLGSDGTHAVGATGGAIDHSHTGPGHTHTGPSHTHTQALHSHTGPSHTHTGPSHTHTQPTHTHTGPSHDHTLGASLFFTDPASSTTTGTAFASGTIEHRHSAPNVATATSTGGTGATGADGADTTGAGGTGATGSGGTGATGTDGDDTTGAGGTGATGSGGTGATGLDGNDNTGLGGTGATGSGGTGATSTNNPPYIAIHYVIRYA